MKPSPFEQRLVDLQLMRWPEEAEELAFLEEYMDWKAAGGPARFDAHRDAQRRADLRRNSQARFKASDESGTHPICRP